MAIVITRHPALVRVLVEKFPQLKDVKVVAHATPDDVRGQDVYGVLPLALAAIATSVTEIPLTLPPELRGVELSEEQVRVHMGAPVTYVVTAK